MQDSERDDSAGNSNADGRTAVKAEVDNSREAILGTGLMLRGYLLALLAGFVWHWPSSTALVGVVAKIIAGFFVYLSCLPLMVASAALRDIIVRRSGLEAGTRVALTIGFGILGILLVIGALIFRAGRHLYILGSG